MAADTWGTSWGGTTGSWLASWARALVEVPDVVGQTEANGTTALEAEGFVVAVETAYSDSVAVGLVISQDPVGGSFASSGATVTITVSLGPEPQVEETQGAGGLWLDWERIYSERRRKRKELEDEKREQEAIEDAIDRELAELLRKQAEKDAERADLERLQRLADQYAGKKLDLPKPVRVAILNAQDARTRNSLEQMRRVIEQAQLEEELAVLMVVLESD